MPNNYRLCVKEFGEAQTAEFDNREMVREADLFLNKRDGQWEPQIFAKFENKPRYTFDECNPLIDTILGELDTTEYDIRVAATGGTESSKEHAAYFSGIIRQIENISSARFTYESSARIMVGTGLSAWRVITAWRDNDSFQQDLMLAHIPNAQDSVWFDPGAVKQDMSDADKAWVLTSITKAAYDKKYPKGSGASVSPSVMQQAYSYKKPDEVIIGEYLYKKTKQRELVMMSDGSVYVVDDNFGMVKDELAAQGISVTKTRKRDYQVVYQKKFDGKDWISDATETVFEWIPIIPVYGNFKISENKVIYWGVVEKLMDAQRIINYSESRKIEEGALAPRGKIWMTKDQAASPDVKATLRTLNTNADPVQFYDHAADQLPPAYQGAPQSNPGLVETSVSAQSFIQRTSGSYDEDRGTAPSHRSGIAIDKLQVKSDNPKRKWAKAMEVALTHTYRIFVKAIPKIYSDTQEMQLLNQDGTTDIITLKQKIIDQDTGRIIELNDLSKGQYDVAAVAGPSFHSRQQETVTTINEIAGIDPTIIQLGADVLLNNINSPGIDKIAARKRAMMVTQGLIPDDQLTKEEMALVTAQREKEPEMSPLDRANLMVAQAQLQETQGKNEERAMKLGFEQQKVELQNMKLTLEQQKVDQKHMLDMMTTVLGQAKTQAETLKLIREATGADTLLNPGALLAFKEQTENVQDAVAKQ